MAYPCSSPGPLDVDPIDRDQPLSLIEFIESFDSWLQETHPGEFERLVRPGTPGEINGVETPLDLDLIDELTALALLGLRPGRFTLLRT
ncbi:MAG TPA: hypothetical protein VF115_08080 [Acidimicrobiia bacterium]